MSTAQVPTYSELNLRLNELALERGEWCGIPVPLSGEELIIEPKNPWAKEIAAITAQPTVAVEPGDTVVNSWYSKRLRCNVIVGTMDGKPCGVRVDHLVSRTADFALRTLGCAVAWPLETEIQAQLMLKGLLSPHMFKSYLLTGTFIETSKRSKLIYLFRRLKPTVAISPHDGKLTVIETLCLHPIGYYADSFAGVMVPTDDVAAHLLLMRGDEHMFWRRANQHSPESPESML